MLVSLTFTPVTTAKKQAVRNVGTGETSQLDETGKNSENDKNGKSGKNKNNLKTNLAQVSCI